MKRNVLVPMVASVVRSLMPHVRETVILITSRSQFGSFLAVLGRSTGPQELWPKTADAVEWLKTQLRSKSRFAKLGSLYHCLTNFVKRSREQLPITLLRVDAAHLFNAATVQKGSDSLLEVRKTLKAHDWNA